MLDFKKIDNTIYLTIQYNTMKNTGLNFYHHAILSVSRSIKSVTQPVVSGCNSRVFIVEDAKGNKTVFRFDYRANAHRDYDVSQILLAHQINAPRVSLHLYQGQFFETYPYLPGRTLQEQLTTRHDWREINRHDIFTEIAWQMKKIADIPVRDFKNIENKDCSSVARTNILDATHNSILGYAIKYGTMLLNSGEQCVCHCDLTPQNVIWDKDGRISAVLDLNAVSIANVNFAAAITGLALENNKLNPDDFFAVCRDIMPDQMNHQHFCAAKKILQRYFQLYAKRNNK